MAVQRPEAVRAVHGFDVHVPRPERRIGQGRVRVLAVPDGDHPPVQAAGEEVDGHVGKGGRNHLVERVRIAAAQVIGQIGVHRLDAGPLAQLIGQGGPDIDRSSVAVSVRLAVFLQRSPDPGGTLRRDHQ